MAGAYSTSHRRRKNREPARGERAPTPWPRQPKMRESLLDAAWPSESSPPSGQAPNGQTPRPLLAVGGAAAPGERGAENYALVLGSRRRTSDSDRPETSTVSRSTLERYRTRIFPRRQEPHRDGARRVGEKADPAITEAVLVADQGSDAAVSGRCIDWPGDVALGTPVGAEPEYRVVLNVLKPRVLGTSGLDPQLLAGLREPHMGGPDPSLWSLSLDDRNAPRFERPPAHDSEHGNQRRDQDERGLHMRPAASLTATESAVRKWPARVNRQLLHSVASTGSPARPKTKDREEREYRSDEQQVDSDQPPGVPIDILRRAPAAREVFPARRGRAGTREVRRPFPRYRGAGQRRMPLPGGGAQTTWILNWRRSSPSECSK